MPGKDTCFSGGRRRNCRVWCLQAEGGGFGGSERHDPHLLYTLSAVQVLALYDRLHEVDADRIAACARRDRPPCLAQTWHHADPSFNTNYMMPANADAVCRQRQVTSCLPAMPSVLVMALCKLWLL